MGRSLKDQAKGEADLRVDALTFTKAAMSPPKSYIICTSPRSGSTLLCRMLQETGVAGAPDSHFHKPALDAWLGYYDLAETPFDSQRDALRAVFDAANDRGRGESDVFGLRMQWPSFTFFRDQLAVLHPTPATDRARIEAAFGPTLFVHLTREDKLDQAISFVKAEQSGLWHRAGDGTELERLSPPRDPVFDASAIAAQMAEFEAMDAAWAAWFTDEDITPLRIGYDALSKDPYGGLGRVLAALGLSRAAPGKATPPVAKLADAINADWAARYRAERGS